MHKIIIFARKKYVCLPYLNFSDPLLETHFFLFGLISCRLIYQWNMMSYADTKMLTHATVNVYNNTTEHEWGYSMG